MSADDENYTDVTVFDAISDGIVIKRNPTTGGAITNVPHLVTHHSPTGYEFGYEGSGPADLALNICEIMLNRLGYHGERVKCWRGDCWDKAFELHQSFKRDFIASAGKNGETTIPYAAVLEWFETRIVSLA